MLFCNWQHQTHSEARQFDLLFFKQSFSFSADVWVTIHSLTSTVLSASLEWPCIPVVNGCSILRHLQCMLGVGRVAIVTWAWVIGWEECESRVTLARVAPDWVDPFHHWHDVSFRIFFRPSFSSKHTNLRHHSRHSTAFLPFFFCKPIHNKAVVLFLSRFTDDL